MYIPCLVMQPPKQDRRCCFIDLQIDRSVLSLVHNSKINRFLSVSKGNGPIRNQSTESIHMDAAVVNNVNIIIANKSIRY